MAGHGAILVLPTTGNGQYGPVAAWVSTAGWARAAQRLLGTAWIVTPKGIVTPDQARQLGSQPASAMPSASTLRRQMPTTVKTATKDGREWFRARRFEIDTAGPWRGHDVSFVWQRHALFHRSGVRLAARLSVPSVVFVPATLVWEAKQWGVGRPGWGNWLERRGEAPALSSADLVACGSDLVAEEVLRLGVDDRRILITPTGVDLDLFDASRDVTSVRSQLGLENDFVVGWVGSFRQFHAVEIAVEAVARVRNAALLLVGDGPERARVESLARARGIKFVMTGTVPHDNLPSYLGAMDVGLVVATGAQVFHYSPLKLAEYLAAGLPVVAPDLAQIATRLAREPAAILVPPGDTEALASALQLLRDDPRLRERLSAEARSLATTWSWDHQVQQIIDALALLGAAS